MNTIEALQNLYVALGGEAADVANLNITPEMISAIADIAEGGGGGGTSALVAHYTITPTGDMEFNVTCDKTFAELKEAFDDEKDIKAIGVMPTSQTSTATMVLSDVGYSDNESEDTIGHFGVATINNQPHFVGIYHAEDDTCQIGFVSLGN